MEQKLYHIKLNWFGEVHEFWTRSNREYGALHNAYVRLAEKVGYSAYFVRDNIKDYSIEEVKK